MRLTLIMILVTGGLGYLSSHYGKCLMAKNRAITILDNLSRRFRDAVLMPHTAIAAFQIIEHVLFDACALKCRDGSVVAYKLQHKETNQ